MAVQIPAQAIADAQASASGLWKVVLAIAGPESGWNARALGDYKLRWGGPIVDRDTPGAFPTSFGYLQMHVDGGLGSGISVDVLLDGASNFRLGAEYIARRLAAGASVYDAMSPWSARPAAWALYQRIEAEGIEGASDPGGGGGGGGGDAGTVPPATDQADRARQIGLAAGALALAFVLSEVL